MMQPTCPAIELIAPRDATLTGGWRVAAITPAAKPSRSGVSCAARSPRKKTGTAPTPVARAVPEAASSSRTASGMEGT